MRSRIMTFQSVDVLDTGSLAMPVWSVRCHIPGDVKLPDHRLHTPYLVVR